MDTGDLHYCGKSIVGYGRFKCSRCGGRCYLSSGEMGERESDASIFEASKRLAYVLCDDCVRVITEQSIRGIVPQGLTPYAVTSEEDFEKTLQDPKEAIASVLGLTAEDVNRLNEELPGWQSVAPLLPAVGTIALIMILVRKCKSEGKKPDAPTMRKMVKQILRPTDTDVSDLGHFNHKRKEE